MPADTKHGSAYHRRTDSWRGNPDCHSQHVADSCTQRGTDCNAQRGTEPRAIAIANCGAEHNADCNAQCCANLCAELSANCGSDGLANGTAERKPDARPDRAANHHDADLGGGNLFANQQADNHRAHPLSVRGSDRSPGHVRANRPADVVSGHPDADGSAVGVTDGVRTQRGAGYIRS